jgi:hypothetical protein
VETSVPFAQGQLKSADDLAVFAASGKPVLAQLQPAMHWPDGSIRWLYGIFEAEAGPGEYYLQTGKAKPGSPLLKSEPQGLVIDTGELTLSVPKSGKGLFKKISAAPKGKTPPPLVQMPDLILTRKDGKIFRASLAGKTRKVVVEESGPMRASLRIEGKCRAEDGEGLFDFILRLQAHRGRPEVLLSLTWLNTTENPSEQLRDIRLYLPYRFEADRLVFGCQTGIYDNPWLKNWPVKILQEDHNWYSAKTLAPDGRWLNLASGGCNGEHCPGWLCLRQEANPAALAIQVLNFWQEYPNELTVNDEAISVGLWPQEAARHLACKTLLPANPEGTPYLKLKYWPLLPHPYLAFFDGESQCLDAPQGLAKTQQILLSVGTGQGKAPSFEKKYWSQALRPVRGFVDPRQIAESLACGLFWPRDDKYFPEAERTFDEIFGWYDRHIENFKCYGKFDYGDFRYMVTATDYICHGSGKWCHMGEMPREGYWNNNEGDPFRELLLYYLRTGNPRAWELVEICARHLLDVDLCHRPATWGLHTHSYGHCYLENSQPGAPDHSWLLGLMEWAGISGDPLVWEWLRRCGEDMAALTEEFVQNDTRSTGMHLHVLCRFYDYTGEEKFLKAARPSAQALLATQREDGSWPAYLWNNELESIGFVDHALAGIADYYAVTGEEKYLPAINKTLQSEEEVVPLNMYSLALAATRAANPLYAALAKKGFRQYDQGQNRSCDPLGRGDDRFWAEWGVNHPETAEAAGRPPQFLKQTRVPSPRLFYALGGLWVLARSKKLKLWAGEPTPLADKKPKMPGCRKTKY